MTSTPLGGDAGGITPGRRYTWSCTGCPTWAGRHWDDEIDADTARASAERGHTAGYPGGGQLVIVADTTPGHPEQRSAPQLLGSYDPDEPMLVPAWAVHTAATLAGLVANYAARGTLRRLPQPTTPTGHRRPHLRGQPPTQPTRPHHPPRTRRPTPSPTRHPHRHTASPMDTPTA